MIPEWMPSPVVSGGYLEGNAVPMPDGSVGLLLRCRVANVKNQLYSLQYACLFTLGGGHAPALMNPKLEWQGFIAMPGGGNKFTVRCGF